MTCLRFRADSSIDALNHKSLIFAWRVYGVPCSLVRTFTVRTPLTASQFRRLPAGLRDRLRTEAS